MQQRTRRPGFTLVEMIIYIALSSMIVVTLLNVMLNVVENREKTQIISSVQQNLRLLTQRITVTAVDAINVNTGSTVFDTGSGSLVFIMSGSVVDPTTFFLSGSSIFVSEGSGDAEPLTTDDIAITQFRLTNLTGTGAATTIKMELSATEAAYQDDMDIETSFTIRR